MDYYCKACGKSVKIKSKKKHLIFQTHKNLKREVISRYRIAKPDFFQVEKNILDYNKKIDIYEFICKWKIHFSNIDVILIPSGSNLRGFLLSKINYY